MANFDRAEIMGRAWALFREIYKYPRISFSSIGRPCFNYCLRKAWEEARERKANAALSPSYRSAEIERLKELLELAPYSDALNYPSREDVLRRHIRALQVAA